MERKSVPKIVPIRKVARVALADPARAALDSYARNGDAHAAMAIFRAAGGMKA